VELESIQERYVQVLRSYLLHTNPHNPGRLNDLLAHIPEVRIYLYSTSLLDRKIQKYFWGSKCQSFRKDLSCFRKMALHPI
jgi:hypothetical protein